MAAGSGGNPYVPKDFEWPYFEGKTFDGTVSNRPLSFLCQIDLAEVHEYDKEGLLPDHGLLSFFYEIETMNWGFDPTDRGCAKVYWFENIDECSLRDFPDDLDEEYCSEELALTFESVNSAPRYEELELHSDLDVDWGDYDDICEDMDIELDPLERHKLLGYADLVQDEMLTECELISRGIYTGDAKVWQNKTV